MLGRDLRLACKFCLSTLMARGCSASNSRKATMCIPHGRPTVAASYLPPAGITEVRFGGSTSPRKTLLWGRALVRLLGMVLGEQAVDVARHHFVRPAHCGSSGKRLSRRHDAP